MTNDTARIVLLFENRTETVEVNRRNLSLQMDEGGIAIHSWLDGTSQRLELRCENPSKIKPLYEQLVNLLHFPTSDAPLQLNMDHPDFGKISREY